ncbi:UDP-N-acetylmuramoyl-tripeptide--D-alanyl-D-alanine ligase [Thalassotalea euphylliae]|uniref:UDP-N-acetylmuramoyl-tripeptide--D-alanyl-D-alanine ligase n=1 Tax=Thalassotalea euphylliae TaxID=1655234 RepID=A0A3E0U587_9GAMM|nr:UDP-N-acetylmuramoyl-tripeptide--D-alanyl-D-alanine ligase [Thalassotalea euphylliae]REL31900.1 UDP-N-acetylmuramoyl-tripeptide--D-alanyl-D-alanine ligase [Thalassotalea euphylliae]
MIPLTLSEIANATGGKLIGADITISAISTDSRALAAEQVFLALKGPNFDGHKFVSQVAELGGLAVIVDHQVETRLPQVVVADTRIALGKIGAYVKAQTAPKTVGITGSSGKTTVKEMVAAILSRLGNVLATSGNFNNDIGVPLTLLRLGHEHDFAVIEMGANHIGEIAYTTNLVKPDVAIINNIAAAHLEGFGDLCGVARAKGEIFEGIPEGGVAVYNQDSKWADKWKWRLTDKKVRRFSCKESADEKGDNEIIKAEQAADCYSANVTLDDNGCANFKLHTHIGSTYIELTIPGKHNVCNAVAAAAIAIECGASLDDIKLGLAEMSPVKGRLNLYQLDDNCKLIDDTYNANVESIKAATELLASYPGYRVLILGDMAELGSDARSYHQEVGEHAKTQGIDTLLTLGVLSQSTADAFGDNGQHFSSKEQLLTSLKQQLANEERAISILVKGSRSAHMEHVVNEIINWRKPRAAEEHS